MGIDIVGPFPTGRGGNRYVLTCICLATRYPSAVPMRNVRATSVAQGCIEMFCNTNFPYQILTDQGAQFTGKLFEEVMSILSIEHK